MNTQTLINQRLADLDTEVGTLHTTLASIKERLGKAREHAATFEGTAEAAGAEVEGSRLMALQTETRARLDAVLSLRNRISEWLRAVGPVDTSVYKLTPPKSLDALQAQIAETRAKVLDLKHELAEVKRAPQPLDDLRQQAADIVARLTKNGAPDVKVTGDGLSVSFGSLGFMQNPINVVAWVFPNEMTERLIETIKERQKANGRKPMTVAQREAKETKLTDAIEDCERRETALVDAAHKAGLTTVLHRADISVAAFLGVKARFKVAA